MKLTHDHEIHSLYHISDHPEVVAVQRFVRFAESTVGAQLQGYYVGLGQHPLGCQIYIGMCIKIKTFI